ncbi:MAG: branched-chain amino acid transport system ATP-binding protein [Moorella sp. (in: firmicutes)]|nr:branched-chain amino acid transport system ATP-binding protein [Moorella sp. (in: firmicutes)]
MLQINELVTGYGDMKVLHGISLQINDGETVALVGSNGAGKTTLLRAISGLIPIWSGSIILDNKNLVGIPAHALPSYGIAHIPQGRGVLGTLSVFDNLMLGAYIPAAKAQRKETLEEVFRLFPILKERQNQLAGTLSGGQQQMLAIGRALMLHPKILILDEPSLGLAPIVVESVFKIITDISKRGVSILVIEQNLIEALGVSSRGYVLETGKIVMEGSSKELLASNRIREAYLGI